MRHSVEATDYQPFFYKYAIHKKFINKLKNLSCGEATSNTSRNNSNPVEKLSCYIYFAENIKKNTHLAPGSTDTNTTSGVILVNLPKQLHQAT